MTLRLQVSYGGVTSLYVVHFIYDGRFLTVDEMVERAEVLVRNRLFAEAEAVIHALNAGLGEDTQPVRTICTIHLGECARVSGHCETEGSVIGMAYRSPADTFNPAVGRKIAFTRAIANYSWGLRAAIWPIYLAKTGPQEIDFEKLVYEMHDCLEAYELASAKMEGAEMNYDAAVSLSRAHIMTQTILSRLRKE